MKIEKLLCKIIFTLSLAFAIVSCDRGSYTADLSDTPTSGNITICADEALQPLVDAEVNTFTSLYSLATVRVNYRPEFDVMDFLMNDSVKIVVANKNLTSEEEAYLKSLKCFPKSVKVAVDAVAIIVNNENVIVKLALSELKNILSGGIARWNEIVSTATPDSIIVVFDNAKSGNVRYLKERFIKDSDFSKKCFAVQTNPDVIKYVKENKNALGIIGVNWISDMDDESVNNFRSGIKVVALKDEMNTEYQDFYEPYQAYMATNQYPLVRDVYVINRESRNGLGTGFAAFFAGDQGQRIVRLAGLLPATMPVRIINVK